MESVSTKIDLFFSLIGTLPAGPPRPSLPKKKDRPPQPRRPSSISWSTTPCFWCYCRPRSCGSISVLGHGVAGAQGRLQRWWMVPVRCGSGEIRGLLWSPRPRRANLLCAPHWGAPPRGGRRVAVKASAAISSVATAAGSGITVALLIFASPGARRTLSYKAAAQRKRRPASARPGRQLERFSTELTAISECERDPIAGRTETRLPYELPCRAPMNCCELNALEAEDDGRKTQAQMGSTRQCQCEVNHRLGLGM